MPTITLLEAWVRNTNTSMKRSQSLKISPEQLPYLRQPGVLNPKMAALLPPEGTEVFRLYTPASLAKTERHAAEDAAQQERRSEEVLEPAATPSSHLQAGTTLPFLLGDPPSKLLNTPLEDLDPYYQAQKTFVVISKGNIISRFNAEPACYMFSPFNIVRRGAISILTHSLFSLFILLTLLTNCVFMTLSDPPGWSYKLWLVFFLIYTFEAVVKVLARGFLIGRFTFLKDPWNWLDFIVVSMAFITQFMDFGNLCAVLIPLKIIPVIPGLKATVGSLRQSVRKLGEVILLYVFTLTVFSIVGLHLFMGRLRSKCVLLPVNITNYNNDVFNNTFDFNNYISKSENHYHIPGLIDALVCGNSSGASHCPEGYTCLKAGRNPNYGFTNYDTIGWAFLSTFRIMTQDFLEDIYHLTAQSAGRSSTFILVLIILLGTFCLVNMIIAMVATMYAEQCEAAIAKATDTEEEYARLLEHIATRKEAEMSSAVQGSQSHLEDASPQRQKRRSCSPCWYGFADIFLKCNCCRPWVAVKRWTHRLVMDPMFDFIITLCIIVNIIFLATEHYPMTPHYAEVLSIGFLVFTAILTLEMVLKLVAMDPYYYFQVGWNIFDCLIVMTSLQELVIDFGGLTVLRIFHVMRVFRLARSWPTFNFLLRIIGKSLGALRNLTLILVLVLFTFSLAAMQLFSYDYRKNVCKISADCELPRWHTLDFLHSFMVMFRTLCGEWIETLWDCMEVAGEGTCIIVYVTVVLIGNLVLWNLFLAVLISSYSGDSLAALKEDEEKSTNRLALARITRGLRWLKASVLKTRPQEEAQEDGGKEDHLALTLVTSAEERENGGSKDHLALTLVPSADPEPKAVEGTSEVGKMEQDCDAATPVDCYSENCVRRCPCLNADISQGPGKVWWNLRRTCLAVVDHQYFDTFMIVIILFSSGALAFEDMYSKQRPVLTTILDYADHVFTCVFVVEMLLKWVSFGFRTYFTNVWCWIDFIILDMTLVSLTLDSLGYSELEPVRVLWTLRALRPLRALSRFQSLKVVVTALVRALPSILNVLLVGVTMWLVFGIMGVNLFAGKFYYCFNETSEEYFNVADVNNKSDCLMLMEMNYTEARWKNAIFNFDNMIESYLSLLQVASFTNWWEVMHAAIDTQMVEDQPEYEANLYAYLYFVAFVIFGCFFILILFVGAIIQNFNQQKVKFGGNVFMTEGQTAHYNAMKKMGSKPQKPVLRPLNWCQGLVFDLVTKQAFEILIMVMICLNMVVMMMETDDQSVEMEKILNWLHFVFTLIFMIECCLKIIALRRHYFSDGWCNFEFVLVITSILEVFVEFLFYYPTTLFRIIRLARLIQWAKGLRNLLSSMRMSFPAVRNIGLLLSLIMYIYSIFGMYNFPAIKMLAGINDVFNFETFTTSFICIFMGTCFTGWNGLFAAVRAAARPPDCDPKAEHPGTGLTGNCGSAHVGTIFFCSYYLICSLLVVCMYIAVILENFSVTTEERADQISDRDFEMFSETWEQFDPNDTQFIDYSKLSDFCNALKGPLRIPKPNAAKLITMDLPMVHDDKIYCLDILRALTIKALGESEETDTLNASMEEKFRANKPLNVSYEPITSTLRRKQEEVVATVIQRAYRKHKARALEKKTGATAVDMASRKTGDNVDPSLEVQNELAV